MKIVVFGAQRRVGLWIEDTVVDINNAAADYFAAEAKISRAEATARAASEAPAVLEKFVAAGKPALKLARVAAAHVKDSKDGSLIQPISSVKLHAPWPGQRIFCAGANYGQHIADYMNNLGKATSVKDTEDEARNYDPGGFNKVILDVTAPGGDLTYPSRATLLDYEAELAVIIGDRGTDIPVEQAKSYIWGITLANDWSDRSVQHARIPLSFNLMKNFNGSLSLGPCIVVDDDDDPQNVDVTLKVNGEIRQDYNTKDMIYSFAEYIAYLSKDMTLVPGDILLGGTGAGTAMDASKRLPDGSLVNLDLFLKVGDVVEVLSPKIGSIRNCLVSGNG